MKCVSRYREDKDGRNKDIDCVRGICIMLMVLGHTNPKCRDFIYLFHMSAFFIVSGYFFKLNINFKNFIKKRIKSLYLPNVALGVFCAIFHNVLLKLKIYSEYEFGDITGYPYYSIKDIVKDVVKSLAFGGGTPLTGFTWFFRTMFVSSIIYYIILSISSKFKNNLFGKWFAWIVCCMLLCAGYYGMCKGMNYRLFVCFSVVILYQIGHIFKDLEHYFLSPSILWLTFALSTVCLIILKDYVVIELMANDIRNPVIFIVVSIIGFLMVYSFSVLIEGCVFING